MKVFIWSVTAAFSAYALPASAQLTGSRLPGASSSMTTFLGVYEDGPASARPSDEAAALGRALARCVVARKPADAANYLTSKSKSAKDASYKKMAPTMPGCMFNADQGARQFRVEQTSFEESLAEALVRRQSTAALAAVEPAKTGIPYWLSADANQRVVQEMAICLADRYPEQSLALVRSNPGSPEESSSFGALSPMMGPCLISGTTLHANRIGVRLALASAVYHRVTDPADAPAAEKK